MSCSSVYAHFCPKSSLTYLVRSKTPGCPLEFKIKLVGFEQNLAKEHEIVVQKFIFTCLTYFNLCHGNLQVEALKMM